MKGDSRMSKRHFYRLAVMIIGLSLHASPAISQQDGLNFISSQPQDRTSIPTSGMAPRMSDVVDKLLTNASHLKLTEKQKTSLSNIPEKYVYPLRKIEAEYDIARMKINKLMKDPDFDLSVAKRETKLLQDVALEMSYLSLDAIAEIRNIVGLENFKTILSMLGQGEKI